MSDTLSKLYLELSNVVPEDTKSARELKLEARVAELEAELRQWRCDTVPGRCRGCPDCQGIGRTAGERKEGGA